jgi:hypothetical protein
MFTEKLSSQLLPGSRSHSQHSRAADSQLRENAGSPAPPIVPSTSSGGSSKVHTSPSKVRHCLRSFHLCTVSSSTRISLLVAITCNGITLESSSLHTGAIYYMISLSYYYPLWSVLIDTRSPVSYRCARTTPNWSPAKCIVWVALLTSLITHQISTRARHQRPSLPQARSPHQISPLAA